MAIIHPDDVLVWAGGNCLARFGSVVRRTMMVSRRGEDHAGTLTRASTRHVIGPGGLVRIVEAGALPVNWWDTDGDGVPDIPTVRVSPDLTNELSNPEDFGAWSSSNLNAVGVNVTTAPDGATTADRLIEDGTASVAHHAEQAMTGLTASTQQVLQCFAKADSGSRWLRLGIRDTGTPANRIDAWFDLDNGVVGSRTDGGTSTVNYHEMIPLPDGWYLCMVQGSMIATSQTAEVGLANANATREYNGDNASSIFVWGAAQYDQLPVDSHMPYAPTSTNGDAWSMPFHAEVLGTQWYARFITHGLHDLNSDRVFQIGGLTTPPRLLIWTSGIHPGGNWQIFWRRDASTSRTSNAAMGAIVPGDEIELLGTVQADGAVQIERSTNGGAATVGTLSSAMPGPYANWDSAELDIGHVDDSNHGDFGLRDLVAVRGTGYTLADFRAMVDA